MHRFQGCIEHDSLCIFMVYRHAVYGQVMDPAFGIHHAGRPGDPIYIGGIRMVLVLQ
jgi:hypothetical protein